MIAIDVSDFKATLRRDAAKMLSMLANDATQVDIFVPTNSPAGKYAAIQHDGIKGRGVGTEAKGPQAGWKYIERAIDDNAGKITSTLERGWANVLAAFGRGREMSRALSDIGFIVQRVARHYAKRSPSKSQYLRTLKTAKGRRNSTFKATPGGLEKSITYKVS